MRRDSAILGFACCLACVADLMAATVMPLKYRLPAHVDGYLQAPAAQPMRMPTDVAVDSTGRVFVADGVNDRIVRFDATGRFEDVITEIGGCTLARPVGVCIDPNNRLWIADTGNGRVLVVHAALDGVDALTISAAGDRAVDPTDVAVASDGARAYVVDNDGHRLLVLDTADGTWQSLGRRGRSLGQFEWPFMVAVAPDGYIYVSETIGARVQRIGPSRRWAGSVGGWGVEIGQFYRPKGVVVDSRGRVLVSDSTMGVIQMFDPRGRVLGVLTDQDDTVLRFAHPMGMALGPDGRLYVVELEADRVAVVRLSTTTQVDSGSTGTNR